MARGLAPATHLVDAGYTETDLLLSSQEKGLDLVGPIRGDSSWQARLEGGYDQTKFTIDWEQLVAICPAGKTSIYWKEAKTASGKPANAR